ncbi:MAG: Xaa-Pro peptidase family protein [Armatimonadota bacterium]|nr:Xaa-Pro peptidase family protein [Armatimonadota bacterium]MDR7438907.1 Xaa-Pro peptidase family protein [Armatimonadota bacterium]MDR7562447.1 Xaa-Pro peptidase family protein [Armatimonadota bacterium]MDR7567035.1 Xaa-Pro peptidase family protein [Armatimonadota bacterium]MDR7601160.1 Xaa-Pro peptidase family protein [Armatimonadota bacterium]
MRSDLERLLEERGYDAMVGMGGSEDPNLFYVMRGAPIHAGALYIHRRGHPPVLCHGTMERGEAERTGLRTRNLGLYNFKQMLEEAGGDLLRAQVALLRRVFEEEGVRGRVLFFGQMDRGAAYLLLRAIAEGIPGIEVVGEYDRPLVTVARMTKEPEEIEAIRRTGEATGRVVRKVADFLRTLRPRGECLVGEDGEAVTIGEVKRRIRIWLAEEGLVDTGTIFSQGRDAGLPHSRGEDARLLRPGEPIVLDIFPRPAGGGYCFDLTRTWVVGKPSERLWRVYRDVLDCYHAVVEALQPGVSCSSLQQRACAFFEERGHPTIGSDPTTQVGYVHSLGHGVGLEVHELPRLADFPGNSDALAPGMVFTLEPGLYYPEEGIGVRLEDTWALDTEGRPVALGSYPLDLVLSGEDA